MAPLPDGGIVRDAVGDTVVDAGGFAFVKNVAVPPDSVNPGLWRQSQLESETGLFQVTDRIYQVRGYDISGITFIEGDTGVIVVDPLTTAEPAAAAADLYFAHRPKRPVVAVIYSHSHTDHYGGVKGVVSEEEVRAGKVRIFAPEGFTAGAMSETVLGGTAMRRRGTYVTEGSPGRRVYGNADARAVFFDSGQSRQFAGASNRGPARSVSGTPRASRSVRSLVHVTP
jgi:alkyl sulfatase BDS1-like metallo-beta-lactamase superfamily hydrolase